MAKKEKTTDQILRNRYTLALAIIACLVIFSQLAIQVSISKNEDDSRIINIAGRQRMLSQRIAKCAYGIYISESPAKRADYLAEMVRSIDLWEKSHHGLQYGNAEMGLPGNNSGKIAELFKKIQDRHNFILNAARTIAFLASDGGANSDLIRKEIRKITENEGKFLYGMDTIVFQYDSEAKAKVELVKHLEIYLMLVTILVLAMEAAFIFRPAEKRIREKILKVRENEESIRRIFESAPVAMILVDGTNLEILKLNELAAQLVNSDVKSAIGQGFGSLWGGYFRNNPELFDRIKSCAPIRCLEADVTIAGRHDSSVLISSNLINYADKPAIIIGLSDISSQKEAENRYRTLHQEFQALLNGLPDGMALLSPDLTISWVNRAMAALVGLESTEIIGRNCHQVLHNLDVPCEVCPVQICFGTGLPEMRLLQKPAENTMELRVIPVKDDKGDVLKVIKVLRDVTEQKNLERQLQNSQKLEAVGKLAGGIAHDFNNILTAVIGYASLISMKSEPDAPVRHYADQILSLSDRAAGLTLGLLAFSRNQVMSPKPTDLNRLMCNVQKLLLSLLGDNVEFALELSPTILTVMADSASLEQVFMNLTSNAKDAMPDGGKVTIRCESCSMDDAFVQAHGLGKTGRYASISVTDTGVGIDEQTMEKIFEPFFTTKDVGQGTGLGLASVYGIIEQHGGFIMVSSALGRGTTFSIYLPLIVETCNVGESAGSFPEGAWECGSLPGN